MTNTTIDYKKLNEELDRIIEDIQSGSLSIDETIKAHDRGQQIIKQLQTYLSTAENKVQKAVRSTPN